MSEQTLPWIHEALVISPDCLAKVKILNVSLLSACQDYLTDVELAELSFYKAWAIFVRLLPGLLEVTIISPVYDGDINSNASSSWRAIWLLQSYIWRFLPMRPLTLNLNLNLTLLQRSAHIDIILDHLLKPFCGMQIQHLTIDACRHYPDNGLRGKQPIGELFHMVRDVSLRIADYDRELMGGLAASLNNLHLKWHYPGSLGDVVDMLQKVALTLQCLHLSFGSNSNQEDMNTHTATITFTRLQLLSLAGPPPLLLLMPSLFRLPALTKVQLSVNIGNDWTALDTPLIDLVKGWTCTCHVHLSVYDDAPVASLLQLLDFDLQRGVLFC